MAMLYTQSYKGETGHRVINVTVDHGTFAAPMSLWVETSHACVYAQELSRAHPGKSVRIETMSRVKAVYLDGALQFPVREMSQYYTDLSPEQIEATKVLVGPGEWV